MTTRWIAALLGSLLVLATVSSSTGAGAEAGAMVLTAEHEQFGWYLTDAEGVSLYLFTNDVDGVSTCYEECAVNWPPLLVEGEVTGGARVHSELLGTTERDDATVQVTYGGWPLYYFARDAGEPGAIEGQGVGGVWFLVSEGGDVIGEATDAAQEPAAQEPAAEEPADEQPADEQPADEQPADEQPADDQPADDQPADEEPADAEPADAEPEVDPEALMAELMGEGGPLYTRNCAVCHGNAGEGGVGPRHEGNRNLARAGHVISMVLWGQDPGMPAFADTLDDRGVAAVGTFIRNSWGNSFGVVTPQEVARLR